MKTYYLYHLCREGDIGDLDKGYIGVSYSPEQRWQQHKHSTKNPRLEEAFNKYTDINMFILAEGEEKCILEMERMLRPEPDIGWNIAIGGSKPPLNKMFGDSNPMFGKTTSDKQKEKASIAASKPKTEKTRKRMAESAQLRPSSHYDVHRSRVRTEKEKRLIKESSFVGYWIIKGNIYRFAEEASREEGIPSTTLVRKCKRKDKYHDFWFIPKKEDSNA